MCLFTTYLLVEPTIFILFTNVILYNSIGAAAQNKPVLALTKTLKIR